MPAHASDCTPSRSESRQSEDSVDRSASPPPDEGLDLPLIGLGAGLALVMVAWCAGLVALGVWVITSVF
jgi:hypothetical protein